MLQPIFKPQTGAARFNTGMDTSDETEANRCWFAACLHVLAHDEKLFEVTQQVTILLDAANGFAERLNTSGLSTDVFLLGCSLARLVQQARCAELVDSGDMALFKYALHAAVALYAGGYKGAQELDYYLPILRRLMLKASRAIDPRQPLLDECDQPIAHVVADAGMGTAHLDSALHGVTVFPRWMSVRVDLLPYVQYDPAKVRVGPSSAVYRAVCVVYGSGTHFTVGVGDKIIDSHGDTKAMKPDVLGATGFVQSVPGTSHIFLERLSL